MNPARPQLGVSFFQLSWGGTLNMLGVGVVRGVGGRSGSKGVPEAPGVRNSKWGQKNLQKHKQNIVFHIRPSILLGVY